MKAILIAAVVGLMASGVWGLTVDDIFGDHMVLQRGKPVRISGTAAFAAPVSVEFRGRVRRTTADASGRWCVEFPAEKAGGPYLIKVSCPPENPLVLTDVMVGEVWLCSGQSNMEYFIWQADRPFYSLPEGEALLRSADDPGLRLFQVCRGHAPDGPRARFDQRDTTWKRADGAEALRSFSAIGYYFARELRRRLKVPVGMIGASWGGTSIQPWIPLEGYRRDGWTNEVSRVESLTLPAARELLDPERREALDAAQLRTLQEWVADKFLKSAPEKSAEALAAWAEPQLDTSAWRCGPRAAMKGLETPGVIWYRFAFDVPEMWVGQEVAFNATFFNDCDETFLDGEKIGETTVATCEYWRAPRRYPCRFAKAGRHVAAVRLQSHLGCAVVGKAIWIENGLTGERLALDAGDWCERIEFVADPQWIGERPEPPGGTVSARQSPGFPTALYNAMVAPTTVLNIGGVIWYQGCSNADGYLTYPAYQCTLIDAWRRAFRDAELPFLLCQISALREHRPQDRLPDGFWADEAPDCGVGTWPLFRLAQDTLKDYPRTGVVCTIDIGDHSDIHPPNKKEVARRLALEAMRISFGDAAQLPGPRFKGMTVEADVLVVTVSNVGAGLVADGGNVSPHLFSVAGDDGVYHWAEAKIRSKDTIAVRSDSVKRPVGIRYCHQQYPPEVNVRRQDDDVPLYPFSAELPKEKERGR